MDAISEQLEDLTLADVVETGRPLGAGAYGEVVEVRLSGLKCAGKRLHGVLFQQSPPSEQRAMVSRFVEECVSLSKLRHPNVVQLLGVHFLEGARLPMMVMELLPTSLTRCLERYRQIPGCLKTSILYDVSLGLQFLHTQSPPIIHRDLTANNVLLTSCMKAKLADLGVARIINLNPAQMTATMTKCPGTPAYMPPEALSDKPRYNQKLDVFSFGNLILHVSTQQWPIPTAVLASDPRNPEVLKPLTEIQRRQKYLDLVDENNPLKYLALQCLQNLPHRRPGTADIASELEQIYKSIVTFLPAYLELVTESLTLNESKRDLRLEINRLGEENVLLHHQNQTLQHEVQRKDEIIAENQQLAEEIAQLRYQILVLQQEAQRKDEINSAPNKENSVSLPYPNTHVYSQPVHTIPCDGAPTRVAVTAAGDVIVTMEPNHCVKIYNKEGGEIGSFGSLGSNKGQFNWPYGVAVTPDSNLLVVDRVNSRLQSFSVKGDHIASVGRQGSRRSQFQNPMGIAIHPSGRIFITDIGSNSIHVLNSDLSYSHKFGSEGSGPGQFSKPKDLAFDRMGILYVVDSWNNRVQKLTEDGAFICIIGDQKSQEVQLKEPIAIAVDQTDHVYVSEDKIHRVSVFTNEGDFLYCFGSRGSQPGEFNIPNGLAFDHDGQLYVCDYFNKRVVVY